MQYNAVTFCGCGYLHHTNADGQSHNEYYTCTKIISAIQSLISNSHTCTCTLFHFQFHWTFGYDTSPNYAISFNDLSLSMSHNCHYPQYKGLLPVYISSAHAKLKKVLNFKIFFKCETDSYFCNRQAINCNGHLPIY